MIINNQKTKEKIVVIKAKEKAVILVIRVIIVTVKEVIIAIKILMRILIKIFNLIGQNQDNFSNDISKICLINYFSKHRNQ